MGKPSKNQRVSQDRPVQKNLPGKAVMYMGSYGTSAECPRCKKKVTRAIMWEDSNTLYCTRACIPVGEN